MKLLFQLRYKFNAWMGKLLADVHYNQIVRQTIGQEDYIIKRRYWYGNSLIFAGNFYLKVQGAHVRICCEKDWSKWMPRVHQKLTGANVIIRDAGELLIPMSPGIVLRDILVRPESQLCHKRDCIIAAVIALREAHLMQIEGPDGITCSFSHGDATIRNVLYDVSTGKACWIDFESLHDAKMTEAWRRADDLRALLYSAAEVLSLQDLDSLCQAALNAYAAQKVLRSLRDQIRYWQYKPIAYHLAQARLSVDKRAAMDEILVRRINIIVPDQTEAAN